MNIFINTNTGQETIVELGYRGEVNVYTAWFSIFPQVGLINKKSDDKSKFELINPKAASLQLLKETGNLSLRIVNQF